MLKLTECSRDRARVDDQVGRKLLDRGELLARHERSERDRASHLLDNLEVDGIAASRINTQVHTPPHMVKLMYCDTSTLGVRCQAGGRRDPREPGYSVGGNSYLGGGTVGVPTSRTTCWCDFSGIARRSPSYGAPLT